MKDKDREKDPKIGCLLCDWEGRLSECIIKRDESYSPVYVCPECNAILE